MLKFKKHIVSALIAVALIGVVAPSVQGWSAWRRETNVINHVHLAGEFRARIVWVSATQDRHEVEARGLHSGNQSPTRPAEGRSFVTHARTGTTNRGSWRAAGVTSPTNMTATVPFNTIAGVDLR
jgi:hypothetical protein